VISCFSIKYEDPKYPGELRAVDWDYWYGGGGVWARSWTETGGTIHWHSERGLDDCAYNTILECFGLSYSTDLKEEFPLERVINMSPAELIAERRKKEELLKLSRIEVVTDNIGEPSPAEKYE